MASTTPEELLRKIFVQQPLKTLGQLCCVCKSWNQIISGKYFIKTHADHQKSSSNINKYVLIDHLPTPPSFLNTSIIGSYDVLESHIYDADDIFGQVLDFNCLEIYGICDGILCLSEDREYWHISNHRIFLWNPFLKKGKKLPPLGSDFHIEHKVEPCCILAMAPCLCFGHYDDDYKVIYINPLQNVYHVHIYSLSTDSWKFLEFDIIDGTNDTYKFDVLWYPKVSLVNGVAYFVQRSWKNNQDGCIVSFDLRCEIFRYINMPKHFDFSVSYFMKEYGELIALVSGDDRDIVMWVLRVGDNNSFTWDKKFTLKEQGNMLLGSINKEELVMWNFDNEYAKKCFLYNVENGSGSEQRFPTLDLEPDTISASCLQRSHYLTESLVLLGESSTNSTSRRNDENKNKGRVPPRQKRFLILKMKNRNMESLTDQQSSTLTKAISISDNEE